MKKAEYLTSKEVANLLNVSATSLYGWGGDDPTKKRPFFPKSQMRRRSTGGDRRLIHQWDKMDILRFIKEAEEKPHYLLSQVKYEEMMSDNRKKSELPPSAFVEFNKLMFSLKQKREVANA